MRVLLYSVIKKNMLLLTLIEWDCQNHLEIDSHLFNKNQHQADCYEGQQILPSRSNLYVTRKNTSAAVSAQYLHSVYLLLSQTIHFVPSMAPPPCASTCT